MFFVFVICIQMPTIPSVSIATQFYCAADNVCIVNDWKCDEVHDCSDGSDENNCIVNQPCDGDMFTCANGQCISKEWSLTAMLIV
ncbi:hypothetical protein DPMN_132520 [Dreissena polymorpha]|uniref:Uncharacterized protein n=1 Tax=Dreissena polymorpha TaxID=45954 RepID=A0A9D4FW48_DREPO|nr:hypothetical protein DPMN_132520 [Dreissena polymorpha]